MTKHEVRRVRQDLVRRAVQVVSKQYLTPRMLRFVFHSDELKGFSSPSPDDHIKIFLPLSDPREAMARDFTPRAWDVESGTIVLDFALHPEGPAAEWARSAEVGGVLEIGGPRGSTIIPDDFDWYLLVGDATALPSIGRRLEKLRRGVPVQVLALVHDGADKLELATAAACRIEWVESSGDLRQAVETLIAATHTLEFPAGDGFIWIPAEASVARDFYRYVIDVLKHPKDWVKAAGYWCAGKADAGHHIS
jgi:NADPH-dependent ferric siderophore reductase